jgi:hypothetical protein
MVGGAIIIVSSILELGFVFLLVGNVILVGTSFIAAKHKKKAKK